MPRTYEPLASSMHHKVPVFEIMSMYPTTQPTKIINFTKILKLLNQWKLSLIHESHFKLS
jgi:hypothetical protein